MNNLDTIAEYIAVSYKKNNKVLVCGNGGLCAEAEHFAAELMGKFAFDIKLPCLSLTCNTSLLTALANDYGYENIFSEQIKVLGDMGDVCITMTTSKSENIIRALWAAKNRGLATVILCGSKYTDFRDADYKVILKGSDTAEIQNEATKYLHKLAYEIKRRLV